MPNIFISYRRDDSQATAGRIYDRLQQAFGRRLVFKDVDKIRPGTTFTDALEQALHQCEVMLVIIGMRWLTIETEGQRRLDDPDDWVRSEIASGLTRPGLHVIPVLVDGATMPDKDELPDDLKALAVRQAVRVRHDPDFHTDMNRLIRDVRRLDRAGGGWRWLLVAGLAGLLIVAVATAAPLLSGGPGVNATPSSSETIAAATGTDEAIASPTPTDSPTPSPTPALTDLPTRTPPPTLPVASPTLDPRTAMPWEVGTRLVTVGPLTVYNSAGGGEISHTLPANAGVVVVRQGGSIGVYQYMIGGEWWWHVGDAPSGLRPGWIRQRELIEAPPGG